MLCFYVKYRVLRFFRILAPKISSLWLTIAINTIQVCLSCQFKQMPLTPGIQHYSQKNEARTNLTSFLY